MQQPLMVHQAAGTRQNRQPEDHMEGKRHSAKIQCALLKQQQYVFMIV